MSWIDDPAFSTDQPFGPHTLPYGVDSEHGIVVRVGEHALVLRSISGPLGEHLAALASAPNLDALLGASYDEWKTLRHRLGEIVDAAQAPIDARLIPLAQLRLVLPFTVADYVDFYSSRHHAENVGRIFRPDGGALQPNWTHLPVGYHGRAGTVVVSGTDIHRPQGQLGTDPQPVFGPTRQLDIEAELGFVCGGPIRSQIPIRDAHHHVFGVVLVNDWSARDVQAFEYRPLGPFLGKSFATSISAWITPLAALDSARVAVPAQPNPLLEYLCEDTANGLDVELCVQYNGEVISRPPFSAMNWSFAQQLAHLSVNGATVRPGDLFASGTVSGPAQHQRGSLLELSWGGENPFSINGEQRSFLQDQDEVVITATAPGPDGCRIGLGEVAGRIVDR